jgi:hypothetical protein
VLIRRSRNKSKYPQGEDPEWKSQSDFQWKGIVLACQNPTDRSVERITNSQKYYQFLTDACKFYGKSLFVKLHPWNSGDKGDKIRAIADQHGCLSGKIGHRIIKNCEFVLVFNSTFVVDCLLRGVPVAQYAPGAFYQVDPVRYTAYELPRHVDTDRELAGKVCDFLMWRYCFYGKMDAKKTVRMLEHYAESRELFPMTDEYCYANNFPDKM